MDLLDKLPAYAGDSALDGLLRKAGSETTAAEIRALLAGVIAAPVGEDPDDWLELVPAPRSAKLTAQLKALHQELASQTDFGLGRGGDHAPRLAALRAELHRLGIDGFIVPRADEHQGEYVPPRAQRLTWLTGFTGSAGTAVVLGKKAAVFVDGRYTLQVREEVDNDLFAPVHLADQSVGQWLEENLPGGVKVGFDPWLHTEDQVKKLDASAKNAGAELIACKTNPLDNVWEAQPAAPIAPARVHEVSYAGVSSSEKRAEVAAQVAKRGAAACVLTLPDSIAWLFNVRGGDVTHTPFVLSFAIIKPDGTATWFVDHRKLTTEVIAHLGNAVSVEAPSAFGQALASQGAAGAAVMVDPASAPAWVFTQLRGAGTRIIEGQDPCQLPKACKNAVEVEGARNAHRRDGAAVTRFLAWLEETAADRASSNPVTEIEAAEKLAACRSEDAAFRDLSFDTISGAGPNGAIVHYRVDEQSNRPLGQGELYLVDSGAQYPDGTTDITRTVAIGKPTAEMKDRFTRVLKGHIAIATAVFPEGTTGSQLDPSARRPLWDAGLDFDHGTGHGVGSYLSVHEGPQRIAKVPNLTALEPGMIVSNEPGYYKAGAYGIRIENLVTVVPAGPIPGAERSMLAFETLTLAPIDRNLIDPELLDAEEIAWLDAYHAIVRDILAPSVDEKTSAWLAQATRPIGEA